MYTQSDLLKSVEELKANKQANEQPEDQDETINIEAVQDVGNTQEKSLTFNEQQYNVGDFVFINTTSEEKGAKPGIFLIENIFTKKSDTEQMIYANQFFRYFFYNILAVSEI